MQCTRTRRTSGAEDGGMSEVLAGIGIAAVASVGINIGNNMQALGLKMGAKVECCKKKSEEEPAAEVRTCSSDDPEAGAPASDSFQYTPPVLSKRVSLGGGKLAEEIAKAEGEKPPQTRQLRANVLYLSGTLIFFTSTFVVFGAMALAPASILAPIESVQFVANIAFARVVNKVRLTRAAVLSSFVIVGGVALAVGSGNHVNKSLGPAKLEEYWQSPKWIGYLIGLVTMAALAQLTWFVYERRRVAASGTKWHRSLAAR